MQQLLFYSLLRSLSINAPNVRLFMKKTFYLYEDSWPLIVHDTHSPVELSAKNQMRRKEKKKMWFPLTFWHQIQNIHQIEWKVGMNCDHNSKFHGQRLKCSTSFWQCTGGAKMHRTCWKEPILSVLNAFHFQYLWILFILRSAVRSKIFNSELFVLPSITFHSQIGSHSQNFRCIELITFITYCTDQIGLLQVYQPNVHECSCIDVRSLGSPSKPECFYRMKKAKKQKSKVYPRLNDSRMLFNNVNKNLLCLRFFQ